jgi:PAS domain S-box-containing protein
MSVSDEPERRRSRPPEPPGFGQADLSNCEREQIHLAGSVQPHGALLLLREPDLTIVQASENATDLLHRSNGVLGLTLDDLGGNLSRLVRGHLSEELDRIPVAVRGRIDGVENEMDGSLHRPLGGGLIVELETAAPRADLSEWVCDALRAISSSTSLHGMCDETARIYKELAGYDRVMVYRFDPEGHGQVLSEVREPHLEAYLGNRYPASDIPQIARRLYERNRVRVLVDVDYDPVPLAPERSPFTGQATDLSLCCLRSMSPIHIQYLKNMGVGATLVASLLVGGKLWGLVACHHYGPRQIPYHTRVVCELIAEAVSTRIAALHSFSQSQAELSVRRLEQRMVEAIATNGDWEGALFDNPQEMLQPLKAAGVALLRDGEAMTAGEVPGTRELWRVRDWLDARPREPMVATVAVGREHPELETLMPAACGVLAVPISRSLGEYLIWFRPEQVRTLTWGGNPYKSVEIGDDPTQLSPRRSFAQWHQVVEGTSEAWTLNDLTIARLIGESVADVIQQFRSVRLLIAQHQLEQIREKVRLSDQPVVIINAAGRILLTNHAFETLLPAETIPRSLEDVVALFEDEAQARRKTEELCTDHRPWRGEASLRTRNAETRTYMVRGDPVLSAPGKPLGYVFMLNDLSERKAAEYARQRFQEDILQQHRMLSVPLGSKQDLVYRDLLASIVGNAQLAALEIADNLDVTRVPEMLTSVQSSVARTTELLEHLIWYADKRRNEDG